MSKHYYTYLALGDSYTIGESVALYESFPYQIVQQVRSKGFHFHPPELVAKTGWTTAQLAENILHTKLNDKYDFVTLLIGVNNQYRNLSLADYESDFEFLVRKSLHFAGEQPGRVIVLSIPNWGATPFAKGKDEQKISKEIDEFNAVNKSISAKYKVRYIDITAGSKLVASDADLLANDKLHYSGKMHGEWASKVVAVIEKAIDK